MLANWWFIRIPLQVTLKNSCNNKIPKVVCKWVLFCQSWFELGPAQFVMQLEFLNLLPLWRCNYRQTEWIHSNAQNCLINKLKSNGHPADQIVLFSWLDFVAYQLSVRSIVLKWLKDYSMTRLKSDGHSRHWFCRYKSKRGANVNLEQNRQLNWKNWSTFSSYFGHPSNGIKSRSKS